MELERQVESLTDEVKRAWGAYQSIQEKMVSQEAELTDEIQSLERSKVDENAMLIAEVAHLKGELDVSRNRFDLLLAENKDAINHRDEMKKQAAEFEEKEQSLMAELTEAKACSSANAAATREQLIAAEDTIEAMRKDHASWMLQSHKRQDQLEQSNAELAASVTDLQRKLIKAQSGSDQAERDYSAMLEIEELRKTVSQPNV